MLQTVGGAFSRWCGRRWANPKHNPNTVLIHLDPFDEGSNDLAPGLPICFLQLGFHFGHKQIESAE
jgi:hypothetical protein